MAACCTLVPASVFAPEFVDLPEPCPPEVWRRVAGDVALDAERSEVAARLWSFVCETLGTASFQPRRARVLTTTFEAFPPRFSGVDPALQLGAWTALARLVTTPARPWWARAAFPEEDALVFVSPPEVVREAAAQVVASRLLEDGFARALKTADAEAFEPELREFVGLVGRAANEGAWLVGAEWRS